MKKLLFVQFPLWIIFLCFSAPANAQHLHNGRTCVTGHVMEKYFAKNPRAKEQYQLKKNSVQQGYEVYRTSRKSLNPGMRTQATITIPVVVHVVMQDPARVTDQQIHSQIQVLNDDFSGNNADSVNIPAAFKPVFGKGNIQFVLAKRTPDDQPSNGIRRINSNAKSVPGENDPVKFTALGGADGWNPNRYLNIWVVEMLNPGDLGYAFMPGLPGLSAADRGCVVSHAAFGTIGAVSPFNKGRTTTHEIGHFFNLDHIWGHNDCINSCSDSDGVDDTPNQNKCTYGEPSFPISDDACSPGNPGIMFMNFMDYVNDAAMCLFTKGQVDKMDNALTSFSELSGLLTSNGGTMPVLFNRDVSVEAIVQPSTNPVYCSNQISPQLLIRNTGSATLNNVRINVEIDGGITQSTNVTLNLASLQTAIIQGSTISVAPGMHQIKMYTSLPNGASDQQTGNDTIRGSFYLAPQIDAPVREGFETGLNNWGIANNSGVESYSPIVVSNAAIEGQRALLFDNYNNQFFGRYSEIHSPQVFFPIDADSVKITYSWAATQYARNFTDTLEVLISTDCGVTFQSIRKLSGGSLNTTGQFNTEAFVPTSNQWQSDTLDITAMVAGRFDNVIVTVRNINGYSNNTYVDNISIYSRSLPQALKDKGYIISPNPTRDVFRIQHYPSRDIRGVAVYTSSGQLIWKNNFAASTDNNLIEIDLRTHPSGVYFVRVFYPGNTVQERIIKLP